MFKKKFPPAARPVSTRASNLAWFSKRHFGISISIKMMYYRALCTKENFAGQRGYVFQNDHELERCNPNMICAHTKTVNSNIHAL
jgi:hypothetical protein